ncbi:MAG: hypothetical protein GTN76_10250 [Candidatus Aenigmarchaeota archaeon]|nr:hypothetical protein [Candidatus Aenigmarchaeota archaeon]
MIIDSAIYTGFYYPSLERVPLDRRLKLIAKWTRLPFRHLYFFLETPIGEAVRRIHSRISQDHGDTSLNRDYWLHVHEYEPVLNKLAQGFRQGLASAQRLQPFHVVEIDTSKLDEVNVSNQISELTKSFLQNPFQEKWMRT